MFCSASVSTRITNFASQVGALDHALANAAAVPLVKAVAHLHVNAGEPAALQALDTNLKSTIAQAAYYAANEFAASDHDPLVIGFDPLAGDLNDDGRLGRTIELRSCWRCSARSTARLARSTVGWT